PARPPTIASTPRVARRRLTRTARLPVGSRGGASPHSTSTRLSTQTARPAVAARTASSVRALRLPTSVIPRSRTPRPTANSPITRTLTVLSSISPPADGPEVAGLHPAG